MLINLNILFRKRGHTDIADWLTVITAVEIKTEDDISNIRTEMRKRQLLSSSDNINMLTDRLDNLVKQDEETKFNKCLREILRLKSCDSFKTLFNEFSSTSDMEKDIALMIINQICQTEELKREIQKQTEVQLESFESLDAVILYLDDLLLSGAYEEAKSMLFVMGNTSAGKSSMIRTLQEYTKTKVRIVPFIL